MHKPAPACELRNYYYYYCSWTGLGMPTTYLSIIQLRKQNGELSTRVVKANVGAWKGMFDTITTCVRLPLSAHRLKTRK